MASQRSIVFIAAGYAMVFLSLMIIVVAQDEAQSASDQWALSSDDDQSKANSWIIQPVKRPNIPIPPGGMLLMTMEPGSNMTMTDNLPQPPPPAQVTQQPTTTQESNEEVDSSSENISVTSQSPADATEPIVSSQNPIEESVQTTEYPQFISIVSEPHYVTGDYVFEFSSTETPATTDNEIPEGTQRPESEDPSPTTQIFAQTTEDSLNISPIVDQTNELISPAPLIEQQTSTNDANEQLTTIVPDTEVTDVSWLQNVVTDGVNGEIFANTETDAAVDGVTTLVSTDVALSTELPEIVVVTEDFLPVTTDASQTEDSESSDGSGNGAVEDSVAPIVPVNNPEDLGIDIELSQDEENQLARKKPSSRHLLSSDSEVEKKVEDVAESKEVVADAVHEVGKDEEEARQYQRRRPYPIRPGDFGPRPPLNRQGYQQNLRPDYNSYDDYNVISRTYEYCYTIWCKFKTQLKNIGLL